MLLTPLFLLFPAVSASWIPVMPWLRIRNQSPDDCTLTSTLPPATLTSIYPTSTIGSQGQSQMTGGASIIYTTALPTLGPDGPGLHTYTITAPCAEAQCQRPAATECPPGFTTTAVVCHVCGENSVTTTLTLPIESATATQGSTGGDTHNGGGSTLTAFVTATAHKTVVPGAPSPVQSIYPWISRHGPGIPGASSQPQVPGGESPKNGGDSGGSVASSAVPVNPKSPASGTHNSPQHPPTDSPSGVPKGAGSQPGDEAKAGSEAASPTSPSDEAKPNNPTAAVVTGRASETKATGGFLFKVALFSVLVMYPLYF